MIKAGEADVVVAGGAEACIAADHHGRVRPDARDEHPQRRPGDAPRGRSTWTATASCSARAPGSWCWSGPSSRRRAARRIYGRLAGVGTSSDALPHHRAGPGGRGPGAGRSRRRCAPAGLDPADVGHVNAHATSTPVGDVAETVAIRKAIGDHPVLTAPKGALGHLLGAAGAVEAIATVLSMRDGVIPPTLNLEDLDPGVELDVVAGEPRKVDLDAAVNDSFGFGGHNVALAFAEDSIRPSHPTTPRACGLGASSSLWPAGQHRRDSGTVPGRPCRSSTGRSPARWAASAAIGCTSTAGPAGRRPGPGCW